MKQQLGAIRSILTLVAAAGICGSAAHAHPMGNFSINHYARITVQPHSVDVLYVLDLAELPTLQLLQKWTLTKESPRAQIEAHAHAEAMEWLKGLRFVENGSSASPRLLRTEAVVQDGAGGLPVMRINSYVALPAKSGKFEYEDHNFAERAG